MSHPLKKHKVISIIGSGAWGIALACTFSQIAEKVLLWSRSNKLTDKRTLPRLPEISLPPNIEVVFDLPTSADFVFLVVPTQKLRSVSSALSDVLEMGTPVISCCKGLEHKTVCLPLDILDETMPYYPKGVLAGPNFAIEVAQFLPAAATLASKDLGQSKNWIQQLSTPSLRLYASHDIMGTQLASAAKNVYAIGAGICIGSKMGENARAALLTRSLAELARLIHKMGGQERTVYGMAGMGDLILTCTGRGSRNYSLGIELGEGKSLETILSERSTVSEGVLTAPAFIVLAQQYKIELPILTAIHRLLKGDVNPNEVKCELFGRRPVSE